MKIKRITAVVLILSVLTLAFGAWGVIASVKNAELRERIALLESNTGQQTVSTSGYASEEAAAEFNGGVVTVGEALEEYNERASYYEMFGFDEADYADATKQDVLESLAEDKILRLKAQELGLYDISEEDHAALEAQMQAEFDDEVEYYMAYRYDESKTEDEIREETIAYLAENGITLETYVSSAEQDYWREKLYDYVTSNASVSDEDLYAFYEERVAADEASYQADFSQYEMDMTFGRTIAWHPEGIRRVEVVHIPFNEDQQVIYNDIQASLADGDSERLSDVDALYQQLLPTAESMLLRAQQGEDFALLNAETGDSYYPESGVYVSAQSSMYTDDFRNAAMSLAYIGDISGLIYTDTGIAIIKYAGDVTPGAVAFEEIRDQLAEAYTEEIKLSVYNTQVFKWVQEANVQYYPERL